MIEELSLSTGPLKVLINIARMMKIDASHDVILLKIFPAFCPPKTVLAVLPPNVPGLIASELFQLTKY